MDRITAQDRADLLDGVVTEFRWAAALADPARLADWEEVRLTMAQLRILIAISRDPGLSPTELAERLRVRPSAITGIMDRLVQQQLAERRNDEADRRVVRMFLTRRGGQLVNQYSATATAFIRTLLQPLDVNELREALTGLGRINASAQRLGLQPEREIPMLAAR